MKLPAQYAFLASTSPLPLTIAKALELLGTVEVPGAKNSPIIIGWAHETKLDTKGYNADSVPWCGLFAAVVCQRANKALPAQPLWAKDWLHFGVATAAPGLGDIMVFGRPGGGGHVAFYIGEDATAYHVLGGNQHDEVCFARITKDRCLGHRRPIYNVEPATVRSYKLGATGPISSNEA